MQTFLLNIYHKDGKLLQNFSINSDDKKFKFQKFIQSYAKENNLDIDNLDLSKTIKELNDLKIFDIKKVLIVEDEAPLRHLFKEYIMRLGHYVETFENAEDAYNSFSQDPLKYNTVLTDNLMPGKYLGTDFAKRIKTISPSTKVFIMTGDIDSIASDVYDYDIDGKIKKPVTQETFLTHIGYGKVKDFTELFKNENDNLIDINELKNIKKAA